MTRTAILTDSHFVAPHTKVFLLQLQGSEEFRFQPGQYVLLETEDKCAGRPGAYSIASPPGAGNVLEFCLNRVPHAGSFSEVMFALKPGARLRLDGPCGDFVLRVDPRDSLFVGMGTGISPLRSMIRFLLDSSSPVRLSLLYGVRDEISVLYREEFERLAAEHPNFRFVPTLSRPGVRWNAATGYVQEHVLRLLEGRRDVDVYVSGLKSMVDEVRRQLERSGHDPAAIFYEKYD